MAATTQVRLPVWTFFLVSYLSHTFFEIPASSVWHGETQQDSLPEWSKGVDSSSTSASCVGSNPTAVIYALFIPQTRQDASVGLLHARRWNFVTASRQFGRVV